MKKKALATKMAAFVMAGAMTMAMGFPAFAVETTPVEAPTETMTSIHDTTLTKTVTVGEKTFAPKADFTFTITEGDPATGTTDNYYKKGIKGGLYFGKNNSNLGQSAVIPFAPGDTTATFYQGSLELKIDTSILTEPGIYHYVIKETNTGYEGVGYDSTTHNVYVYITNENGERKAYITSTIVTDDNKETAKHTGVNFTNTYGTSDESSLVKKLVIKKEITGAFASQNDEFTVKVKVDQQTGTGAPANDGKEKYFVEVKASENATSPESTFVLESGQDMSAQEYLRIHGGYVITIYGLTENDTFYVEEVDKQGYVETTTANGNIIDWEDSGNGHTGKIKTGANSGSAVVTITNNKTAATPTGIVTEYAPYILLVAAAGAFAVLFLRRKKEEF